MEDAQESHGADCRAQTQTRPRPDRRLQTEAHNDIDWNTDHRCQQIDDRETRQEHVVRCPQRRRADDARAYQDVAGSYRQDDRRIKRQKSNNLTGRQTPMSNALRGPDGRSCIHFTFHILSGVVQISKR